MLEIQLPTLILQEYQEKNHRISVGDILLITKLNHQTIEVIVVDRKSQQQNSTATQFGDGCMSRSWLRKEHSWV
jgi:hypothetical protein